MLKRYISETLLRVLTLFSAFVLFFPLLSLAQPSNEEKKLVGQYMKLYAEGRFVEAIQIAEKVLATKEKTLGPDHPDTATSLNNLALIYQEIGDYQKALLYYYRALAIHEKSLGPGHPDTATSLNNLAGLYQNMGDYARAEPLYRRALAIYEKSLGPEHPDTATSLNNLAELYQSMGDYARAEPLCRRALAITVRSLGPEHPDTATSLNNLAGLYQNMGDYAKAELLYRRALEVTEKSLGPGHPATGISLNNLAMLYKSVGDYAKAELLYRRALEVTEKSLGPGHPATGTSLNNLAGLYQSMGDYARAELLYRRALEITEKSLGPGHPATGTSLNNLAMLYKSVGDHAKAESLYLRALEIKERTLGSEHPSSGISLNNLAALYIATGRNEEALPLMLRAQGIDSGLIDQVMGFTSEDRKMKFLSTKENNLYRFLCFVSTYMQDKKDVIEKALSVWLQRKGAVLEAQKRFQDALVFSDDPRVTEKFQELAQVRSRLSRLIIVGPRKENPEAYRKKIKELERHKERLEAELSKLSSTFAKTKKMARADSKQVSSLLPKNSVLVDFVKLHIYNFKAKGTEKKWSGPRYHAFILPSGDASNVSLIDLGDAGEIDRMIGGFKRNIGNYQADPEGKEISRISRRLYDCIFAPIARDLKGVKVIFISPDGNLNLVPFEILKSPDGRYLIEDYTFNYLGTGRDILGFGMVKAKSSPALIMGDPDYNLNDAEQKVSLKKLGITPTEKRAFSIRSRDMFMQDFSPLPGTKEEVESIASLMGRKDTLLYTGKDAIEEALMRCANPKVLHLATHGFFLADQNLLDENRKTQYENPLVRSGIVLAGVNRSMKIGSDEGFITSEKILALKLHGTDLVVLSACETGLGDIKNGEGVFGLRRAFIQAGTKGLVMSMWSVPDRETKEIMVNFYTNMLKKKMNRPDALRQAILTELSEVKKRYNNTNPFFWGAFVYMGEP